MIELCFCQPQHEAALRQFYLPNEQKRFTALPAEALIKCAEDHEQYPVVILSDQYPIGFFVLHLGEGIRGIIDIEHAVLIRALSVNYEYQGQGHAMKAMKQLPSFVREHFPAKYEIVLVVNQRNRVAKHLYLKAGFQDKGVRREGLIGPQDVLRYFV
ncbi:GNAT family N-acetyltransferase [Tuberibacillus sp. Marseille-P3662]|uniref:GNAT family N-acetyltransferase n=1 Tax=Tuberibacillus sp. Marseille-P3662 TaxID=1965358 RepID=UPI000A1CBED3|nr:GNAT family N-acetyltransferase [Tuberibacillus sp. Marseille-P3662]